MKVDLKPIVEVSSQPLDSKDNDKTGDDMQDNFRHACI